MFTKYLDDYYRSKIDVKTICQREGCAKTTFARWLRRNGMTPRQTYLKALDTGIAELDQTLKTRYSSIVNRCNGKSTDYYGRYNGKEYVPVYEWVEFCNSQRARLVSLWETYIQHGRDSKYAVSIDRVDDEDGYVSGNMQFVTHGFNSWKRTVAPIAVAHEGETSCFLTREEASRFYGLRRQALGEVLNGNRYSPQGFGAVESTVAEVLAGRSIASLEAYYDLLLHDDGKRWDERKRWEGNHR